MKSIKKEAVIKREALVPELLKLALFAAAFGYIEGSVAHYLRLHFYPLGFSPLFSLNIDLHTLLVEMGREFATLIVLLCVTMLTKGPALRRLANFIFLFAVWDIVYYIALFAFEGWPKTPLDWDVLFLIPVPWFAPVLAPVSISSLGITGAVIIRLAFERTSKIRMGRLPVIMITAALLSWLISFTAYPSAGQFPESYNWILFFSGVLFSLGGLAQIILLNFTDKKKKGGGYEKLFQ